MEVKKKLAGNERMKAAAVMVALLIAHPANAQTLYKCRGADNVTRYQQTACEADDKVDEAISYRKEPDSTQPAWTESPQQHSGEFQQPQTTVDPGNTRSAGIPDDELRRRLKHRQDSRKLATGRNEHDRARRAELDREIAELRDQLGMQEGADRQYAPAAPSSVAPTFPAAPPIIRQRSDGAGGIEYVDQSGTEFQSKALPGTNATRLHNTQTGQRLTCRTDDFGNTRCN